MTTVSAASNTHIGRLIQAFGRPALPWYVKAVTSTGFTAFLDARSYRSRQEAEAAAAARQAGWRRVGEVEVRFLAAQD